MMTALRVANLGVAFLRELCARAALSYTGVHLGHDGLASVSLESKGVCVTHTPYASS